MSRHQSFSRVPTTPRCKAHSRSSLPGKQRGMGFWGYMALLLVIAAVITLSLRLGPHYMNQQTVVSIINGLGSESVHQIEKRKIRALLKKRFKINTLYDLDPLDIIEIVRTKEHTKLNLNYERREPIVYNVDAVLTFNGEFEFR